MTTEADARLTRDADDATELAGMLTFLSPWLAATPTAWAAESARNPLTGDHDERRPNGY